MVARLHRPHEAAASTVRQPDKDSPAFIELRSAQPWTRNRPSPITCNCRPNTIPIAAIRRSSRCNGAGTTPLQQIDWWAGAIGRQRQPHGPGHAARLYRDGGRLGQARPAGIRVFGPRACRGAGQPARRLPAVFHRHRPGVICPAIRWAATRPGTWRSPIRTNGPA